MPSLRIEVIGVYSSDSDFATEEWSLNWAPFVSSPTRAMVFRLDVVAGGTEIRTDDMFTDATLTTVAVKNLDKANRVTLEWLDADQTGVDARESARIPPGGILLLPGVFTTTSMTLTANGATSSCLVMIAQ